jgi:hypothetical protein
MQALTWAFQGIFGELDEYRGSLHWLDAPYDEIGIVHVVDPGRERRILELLREEGYAQEQLVLRLERALKSWAKP